MMKGIRVLWPGNRKGSVEEVEYFYGVDVHDLGHIPEFTSVPVFWPKYRGGTSEKYAVRAKPGPLRNGEVRLLAVSYCEADNGALVERYKDSIYWGTNTIVLKAGALSGRCRWRPLDPEEPENASWESFDICAGRARPLKLAKRKERDALFRSTVLALDGKRCVLTGEKTQAALEAAHLVPAKRGQNDVPPNGIALRRDLHALFDARLFTFDQDGAVMVTDERSELSDRYSRFLANKRLRAATYERVQETLTLAQFRER